MRQAISHGAHHAITIISEYQVATAIDSTVQIRELKVGHFNDT